MSQPGYNQMSQPNQAMNYQPGYNQMSQPNQAMNNQPGYNQPGYNQDNQQIQMNNQVNQQMSPPRVTGIFSQGPTTFRVKEEMMSISHDDFSIMNMATRQRDFNIKRNLISVIRQTKTMYDANGKIIWSMEHPLFKAFMRKYKFYSPNGALLFQIKNHFRLPYQGKKLSLTLPDGSKIVSKGNLLDRISTINSHDNRSNLIGTVATIEKPVVSFRSMMTNLQGYTVNVSPYMDIPVCFAFVAVLDEERERKTKGTNAATGGINPLTYLMQR